MKEKQICPECGYKNLRETTHCKWCGYPLEVIGYYKKTKCPHKHTVAINEEGHAGVFCLDCGKQLAKEC